MKETEWYLKYELQHNHPGLLADISSLLGMLSINIITINGVAHSRRGMLITSMQNEQVTRLSSILNTMDTITVTKLRKPLLRDRLAVRHGSYIINDIYDNKTIRFIRDVFGFMITFLTMNFNIYFCK